MTNHVPEGSGWGTGVPGPTRANGRLAPGLRALAAPRPLALPQPLAALPPPTTQRTRMLLNRQKPNLLLHRNFCEVRGLNSPEVFA